MRVPLLFRKPELFLLRCNHLLLYATARSAEENHRDWIGLLLLRRLRHQRKIVRAMEWTAPLSALSAAARISRQRRRQPTHSDN